MKQHTFTVQPIIDAAIGAQVRTVSPSVPDLAVLLNGVEPVSAA
jgi:hypothetical protein